MNVPESNWRSYLEQSQLWPATGRHILAVFDDETISVYQAYRRSIALFAVENQKFGGEFSFTRMSWIKPNFLWMMYRSSWATMSDQEHILAVRIKRDFFDDLLRSAVPSTFDESNGLSFEEWKFAVATSDVRLQWDPDHDPFGNKVERRAIQLGLRGNTLQRYGSDEVVSISDITNLVHQQRERLAEGLERLLVPPERIYEPA